MSTGANESGESGGRRWLRRLRRLALALLALVGLLALAVALLLAIGPTVNLKRFVPRLEAAASDALGQPVGIGELRSSLRLTPTIGAGGLTLGPSERRCARVATAEVELPLLPLLLRDELRLDRVALTGAEVDVPRCVEGWSSRENRREASEEPRAPPEDQRQSSSEREPLRVIEIGELALDDVEVVLAEGDAGHRVEISELRLQGPEGEPVKVEAIGGFDEREVGLTGSGGQVAQLQGTRPWPLGLRLRSGGVELELLGTVPLVASGGPLEMDVQLRAARVAELLELFGQELPLEEPLALDAHLTIEGGGIELGELRAEVAGSSVRGRVSVELGGERPRVEGELQSDRLALEPWLDLADRTADGERVLAESEGPGLREWQEIEVAPFLAWLGLVDGRLAVEVDEVTGLDLVGLDPELRELGGTLVVEGGRGEVELSGSAMDSPIVASASASADSNEGLRVEIEGGPIALAQWLPAIEAVEPDDRLSSLRFQGSTTGATLGEWAQRLDAELSARGVRLARQLGGDLPVWTVEDGSIDLRQRAGQRLEVDATARSNGETLTVRAATASIASLLAGGELPIELSLDGPELGARVEGATTIGDGVAAADLELSASLDRLSAVAPWTGISLAISTPATIEGTLKRDADGRLDLDLPTLELGNTSAALSLLDVPAVEEPTRKVAITSPYVDLDEIIAAGRELFGSGEERQDGAFTPPQSATPTLSTTPEERALDAASAATVERRPWWQMAAPRRVVFELRVDRIERRGVDIDDAEIHLERERDGSSASDVAFRIGEAPFTGSLEVETSGASASVRLLADTTELDIGSAMEEEGWVDALELEAGRFAIEATAEGSSVAELWRATRGFFELEDVVWQPGLDPGEVIDPRNEVRVDFLRFTSSETEGLVGSGRGQYREVPVTIDLATDRLLQHGSSELLPFRVELAAEPDTRAEITGQVTLPIRAEDVALRVELGGSDLSWWGPLLDVELPALGPYRFGTDVRVEEERLDFSGLSIDLGDSHATGELRIDGGADPVRVAGSLDWSELHLRDFVVEGAMSDLGEESAEGGGTESAESAEREVSAPAPRERSSAGSSEQMVEEGEGWALQRDWLAGRDLDFRMTVAAFHSGRDEESDPGSAELRLRLVNGDLDFELPRFEVGVGSIDGHLRVRSAPEQAETDLSLRIRNLDYTPLTRQLNPEAEEAGRLSLYADLEASSAWGEPVALTARGPLAVLIEPERAESFVLDLWGDDVLRNLFTVLGWASSPSTVNCMAARGTLEAGLMKDLRVLADTTRVRVKGKGKLDVGAQTISLKLRPQPKKRTLLNLSTPVSVRGDLWDPEIRPATGAMVELGFRVVTWAYTVYLQVFKQPLPADDTEACVRLLEGYVDDERWRPGKFLLEPGSLVEEVMDEHSFGDS